MRVDLSTPPFFSDPFFLRRIDAYRQQVQTEAGLTPMQTLVAATGGAARVLRIDDRLGTLEPKRWAGCVVLNANPLSDIRNTREIDSVWIAGRRLPGVP